MQLIVVVVVVGKTAAVTRGDHTLSNTETHGIQRVAPVADHPLGVKEKHCEPRGKVGTGTMNRDLKRGTGCFESQLQRKPLNQQGGLEVSIDKKRIGNGHGDSRLKQSKGP